ncbi:MAG: hypothetical protein ACRECD_08675 [Burkholderiaceae bacterium]
MFRCAQHDKGVVQYILFTKQMLCKNGDTTAGPAHPQAVAVAQV